ncbi:hypothetical protein [Ruminiclostridium papyrosolvens]|uniref:Peptidase n=1 Tax=Ruminiclostridium papyrosolvens C7 TaxID=1330534 RepID=U4QWM1_9FIRM|nr:hypothetical protein [Ruminiclostridium papyrosolvens]EPR07704.1 hypothetical protein L323_19355 [Ruminiclostridium papyrosolvens C7]
MKFNKKKLLSLLMVVSMSLAIICPMNVLAAEKTDTKMHVEYAPNKEIKSQEAVQVTKLISAKNTDKLKKLEKKVNISSVKKGHLQNETGTAKVAATESAVTAQSTVVAGTVSGYLSATSDAELYSLNLQPGIYLQAQLTTPANPDLDYDLYLLDSQGNVLCGSEYFTQINGTSGTLPEALGYITSGDATATYYLYVHSSNGGSVSEAFTLDYSVSSACDNYEIDEHVSQALAFTYGTGGAYVNARNLSSPIDNDWYVITIPSSRIYDKLQITATTPSANTCSVQVYRNAASSGFAMQTVTPNGNNFSVGTGTYYIRVSNAKTMEEYNDADIQNYTLTVTPILRADTITITDLNGTEGLNHVVTYPGYGTHFRTGTGTLTISGYATVKDPTTNVTYAVAGVGVTGMYYNPYWDRNNTPSCAVRTGTSVTDSSGRFNVSIGLPSGVGGEMYDSGVSYHYFDVCGVQAYMSDNTNVRDEETIFHLAYSMYHGF